MVGIDTCDFGRMLGKKSTRLRLQLPDRGYAPRDQQG